MPPTLEDEQEGARNRLVAFMILTAALFITMVALSILWAIVSHQNYGDKPLFLTDKVDRRHSDAPDVR